MKVPIVKVALANDHDLIVARHRTKQIAEFAGLSLQDQTRLITAVSELARNAVQYAGGGTLTLGVEQKEDRQYIEAVITDQGPGIRRLDDILDETYHSRTGLGKGIVGSKRIVDLFSINTSNGNGTTISIGKYVPTQAPPITPSAISGWMKRITKESAETPIQQLQDQNKQLMDTLEELQQYKTDLEQQLKNVQDLNKQLDLKTQQLAQRTFELQDASKHKSAFLANMSHEIRTPLNAMLGINRLLSRTVSDDEQKRLLALSREAGKSLLALINDVLDLSQIEAGKLRIEETVFETAAPCRAAVDLLNTQATEKGLQLHVLIDEALPPQIIGDQNRVRQVLINLVGNAVKFSDDGVVRVSAVLMERADASVHIHFEVTDNGPGITPGEVNSLFQSFTQLDGSSTRKHGGSGLGLAISKHLVEVLGGKIGVHSQPGSGSTFWFELPFRTVPESTSANLAPTEPTPPAIRMPGSMKDHLILVAEDHPVNQMVMSMELQEMGLQVQVVSTGREAVEAAQNKALTMIFMDCQMPEMDGYEATRQIRQTDQRVPIVALTANAMDGDRERCIESGMNDYLSKPFEIDELAAMVMRWIPKAAQVAAIDTFALKRRFRPEQIQQILKAFLDDLPASTGRLEEAVASEDLVTAASVAHSFKSACSMIFAAPLAELTEEIEQQCKTNERAYLNQNVEKLKQLTAEVKQQIHDLVESGVAL